jgi:signal transduction histidine kinase
LSHLASLRLRLLVGGALWIAFALAASWIFIFASFSSLIEHERRSDLQASLDRIVAEIDPDSAEPIPEGPLRDPRYDTPLSGVYWQVRDFDGKRTMKSRSLWDFDLPSGEAGDGRAVLEQVEMPDGPTLIVLTQTIRTVRVSGEERRFQVSVAEERSTEDDPVTNFGTTLALFLTILALMLFLAAWVQVQVGLRPLAQLRRDITSVRRGETARLPERETLELKPVTRQVNELLDAQEATISFVRERAADLAHGLKTPLAVLGATADRLNLGGDKANAETIRLLADQMNDRIDYQLRIARLRFRTRAQGVSASINDVVLRSVSVLRKGRDPDRTKWVVDLEDRLDVDMDQHDLMELVGIILENAQQWAIGKISVRGRRLEDAVELVVDDDGGGMTDEQISRLGQRGVRLDERSDGHGLGLAIAYEIVRLNNGLIRMGRSPMGGLSVHINFIARGGRPEDALRP